MKIKNKTETLNSLDDIVTPVIAVFYIISVSYNFTLQEPVIIMKDIKVKSVLSETVLTNHHVLSRVSCQSPENYLPVLSLL